MHPYERDVLPQRGPHFYREDGELLFKFVVDITNVIGPRKASRADQEKHAEAWAKFAAAEDLSPLDRDGSGEAGGSLPVEPAPATIERTNTPTQRPKRAYTRRMVA